MKKKWLAVMLAAVVALSAPVQASAVWQKTADQNWQWSENETLATGWKQIDGVWYHFDAKGNMSTGWMNDGKSWYYLKADGSMKTGWLKDEGQWYYLNANGEMATGWKTLDGKSYYLNGSGKMVTGWQQVDGKWYHMTVDGVRESGWIEVNGQRYFLDANGTMQTGVVQIDGKTYFLGENGQVLTGRLWVDGERYDFADTGEATGSKKPVPEKAFDTQGNQTQVVEEKPTQSDKEDDGNTHTGGISGWYPDIDWNPGSSTGDNEGSTGGTVNPDPEEPDGGDQGGTDQPNPTLTIYMSDGSWKETNEGIEFSTKEGTHLSGDFQIGLDVGSRFFLEGHPDIMLHYIGISNLFAPVNEMSGYLSYWMKDEEQIGSSTLIRANLIQVVNENGLLTLTYGNLDKKITVKLKIADDKKTVTWMDVSAASLIGDRTENVYTSADFDILPDTVMNVHSEQELRSALAQNNVQKIIIDGDNFNYWKLSDSIVIERDVEIQSGTQGGLLASSDWHSGDKPLISIQNGAKVRLSAGTYTGGMTLSTNAASSKVIEVVDGTLEMSNIKLNSQNMNQTLLYLKNANAKIYDCNFGKYYGMEDDLTVGIEMDTSEGSVSYLTILSATFDSYKQIISGSPDSVVDLPSGFTEFINEQSQREWTNDPSKIPGEGEEGGDDGEPELPQSNLEITVPDGSWEDSEEGIKFATAEGKHIEGNFSLSFHNGFTYQEYEGIVFNEFLVNDLFVSSEKMTGRLEYQMQNGSNDTALLSRNSWDDDVLTLKFENPSKSFTIRLKVTEDQKTLTWLGVSSESLINPEYSKTKVSVRWDVIPDTTAAVHNETELRQALADTNITEIALNSDSSFQGEDFSLKDTLIIDRDVKIYTSNSWTYFYRSDNWQDDEQPLILIQDNADVMFSSNMSFDVPNAIKVIDAKLTLEDIYFTTLSGYSISMENGADVKIYECRFSNYAIDIQMDMTGVGSSKLDIKTATFENRGGHQIISGSPDSVVDLPSGFTEFINEQSQREWTNDPSKIPSQS